MGWQCQEEPHVHEEHTPEATRQPCGLPCPSCPIEKAMLSGPRPSGPSPRAPPQAQHPVISRCLPHRDLPPPLLDLTVPFSCAWGSGAPSPSWCE